MSVIPTYHKGLTLLLKLKISLEVQESLWAKEGVHYRRPQRPVYIAKIRRLGGNIVITPFV